jgi:hypothetical protein
VEVGDDPGKYGASGASGFGAVMKGMKVTLPNHWVLIHVLFQFVFQPSNEREAGLTEQQTTSQSIYRLIANQFRKHRDTNLRRTNQEKPRHA